MVKMRSKMRPGNKGCDVRFDFSEDATPDTVFAEFYQGAITFCNLYSAILKMTGRDESAEDVMIKLGYVIMKHGAKNKKDGITEKTDILEEGWELSDE